MSDNQADILAQENDLTILYGNGQKPGWVCHLLFQERLAPVSAPSIAKSLAHPANALQDTPIAQRPQLLDYPRLHPDWIDWQIWTARVQMGALRTWPRQPCRTYAQSIGEAINEQGIALGNLDMLASELETGQLVQIGDTVLTGKDGYYLAYPERAHPQGNARHLMNFLLGHAP